jgi:general secretion pathway protein L
MSSQSMLWRQTADIFSHWIESVASTAYALLERFRSQRHVQVIEDADDTFTFHLAGGAKQAGIPDYRARLSDGALVGPLPARWRTAIRDARMEVVLRPARFLFRPLALPKRAAEFLDGIIRAQIDRLTPWSADEAVFHWSQPTDIANDQVEVTIAATARSAVEPYIRLAGELGAASIAISAAQDGSAASAAIKVFEQRSHADIALGRLHTLLAAIFLASAAAAGISSGLGAIVGGSLDTERDDLAQKISARRIGIMTGQDSAGGSARYLLEQRKRTTPSSVIVIEALSRILPDHTYVTELRIDGDKLQIVGMTRDAPSLIQLIEHSKHFMSATFFAPTTQTPGEAGERFHIEARIKPEFSLGT